MRTIEVFAIACPFLFAGCAGIDDDAPEVVLGINRGFAGERTISVGANTMPAYIERSQTISRPFGKVNHIGIMWYADSKVIPGGKAIAMQVLVPSSVPKPEPIVCHISSAVSFYLCIQSAKEYIVTRGGKPVRTVASKYQLTPGAYHILVRELESQAGSQIPAEPKIPVRGGDKKPN